MKTIKKTFQAFTSMRTHSLWQYTHCSFYSLNLRARNKKFNKVSVPAVQQWGSECFLKQNKCFAAVIIGLGTRIKDLPERRKHKIGSKYYHKKAATTVRTCLDKINNRSCSFYGHQRYQLTGIYFNCQTAQLKFEHYLISQKEVKWIWLI